MNERDKVLYISQEISPYLPDTPLSLLGKSLPQGTQEKGYEVRTFMPKYGCINERRNQLHEVIRLSGMNVIIDDTDHPLIIKVATLQPSRMQVYFIDNDDYFHFSPDKTLEIVSSPDDNDERLMFFSRGVIETVKKLRWNPALVHCLGWVSALIPLFAKRMYADDPTFASSKIVYALHDADFKQPLDPRLREKLEMMQFDPDDLKTLGEGPVDYLTLNKLAMDFADAITATSDKVDPALIEYARSTGKPFMEYSADENPMIERYADFYKTITE